MPTQAERIEEVFAKAIDLPTAERTLFVEAECQGDMEIRTEVDKLLKFHQKNRTSEFVLDKPLVNLEFESDFVADIAESEGDTIGRYKLLERIGEGGMGVVYMAEQIEGVRRRVALKIIKLGMDTRQVIARFEAERQAMAMFDHPNITRVLDAGSTSTGRPYFVMELVRGTNIAKYARKRSLSLRERLELFVSVCNAVQHAHQKGIIHRDLKPSNILVTHFDGIPVPKVIDFGIAKAIGTQRLTDKTLFTRYSSMVGTPQYMSPEQAELTGIDIDTRSDIYSLGVLLYELVTGSTPIAGSDLKELHPVALYETLRDAAVETPSIRLARTSSEIKDSFTPISSRQIGNELDWIIMKSLSRDRSQRYASANEFATEIQRFLDGEPVMAAPPSQLYRIKSYFRRHRTVAMTATIVVLSLLTATIACSIFAINAKIANDKLSQVVGELKKNVAKLEIAQNEATEARVNLLYDSSHAIALEKFGLEFQDTMYDIAEKTFVLDPDIVMKRLERESTDNQTEDDEFGEAFEVGDFYGFMLCTALDGEKLLAISSADLLQTPISRIRRTIDNREYVMGRVFEDTIAETASESDTDISAEEEHEHSPECLLLQKAIDKVIVNYRPDFFRMIVIEYRRTFGDQDARVADGLQLLAASLIDINEYDEAEAHLRESAMMGDETQNQNARALLKLIDRKRQQTLIKPKQSSE